MLGITQDLQLIAATREMTLGAPSACLTLTLCLPHCLSALPL